MAGLLWERTCPQQFWGLQARLAAAVSPPFALVHTIQRLKRTLGAFHFGGGFPPAGRPNPGRAPCRRAAGAFVSEARRDWAAPKERLGEGRSIGRGRALAAHIPAPRDNAARQAFRARLTHVERRPATPNPLPGPARGRRPGRGKRNQAEFRMDRAKVYMASGRLQLVTLTPIGRPRHISTPAATAMQRGKTLPVGSSQACGCKSAVAGPPAQRHL